MSSSDNGAKSDSTTQFAANFGAECNAKRFQELRRYREQQKQQIDFMPVLEQQGFQASIQKFDAMFTQQQRYL
jgi:hypothetical protein